MVKQANTLFGISTLCLIKNKGITQAGLARATGVSNAYANHLLRGRKVPSPEWVDLIADVVGATKEQRNKLHWAAARSAGYKLSLIKDD